MGLERCCGQHATEFMQLVQLDHCFVIIHTCIVLVNVHSLSDTSFLDSRRAISGVTYLICMAGGEGEAVVCCLDREESK